ncbi:MAG: hypothetical protein HY765_01475 [Rhodomicrobium sp.]|nr:hypothetical protein [Rhodomicrobium sp.]
MIQAIMLIALGFLGASLIGVLLAPSLWNRAYRLSRKRLEQSLPLTLSEIEATQDQLKASYAVRMRRLESALANAKQKAAMQLVDNSRLQMQIAALKDQIADLDLKLAERRNAATVLEQTITKRFPELDHEIAGLKEELQERSFELQDLSNKLNRRNEELAGAERAAAFHEEEAARLRQVLEKSSADRSGRRLRRASQWNLDDYRAEYDRLNLELSKMRQQLAQLQDREAQQAVVVKEELQKLAELILISAQPKGEVRAVERLDTPVKRVAGPELRRDRPVPWPEAIPAAVSPAASPLEERLQQPLAPDVQPALNHALMSPVLNSLPEATTVLTSPHPNASREAPSLVRSTLLREAVPGKAVLQALDAVAVQEAVQNAQKRVGPNEGSGARNGAAEKSSASAAETAENGQAPQAAPQVVDSASKEPVKGPAPASALQASSGAGVKDASNGALPRPGTSEAVAEAKADQILSLGALEPLPSAEEPVSSFQNLTLLDRLRGVNGESAEAEK